MWSWLISEQRLREECLNQNVFVSLAEARRMVEAWRQDYNRERPHSALAGLSPEQFRASYYRNIKNKLPPTYPWDTKRSKVAIRKAQQA